MFHGLLGHAFAGVGDSNDDLILLLLQQDAHIPSVGSVLDCISNEIEPEMLKEFTVAGEVDVGEVTAEVQFFLQPLVGQDDGALSQLLS